MVSAGDLGRSVGRALKEEGGPDSGPRWSAAGAGARRDALAAERWLAGPAGSGCSARGGRAGCCASAGRRGLSEGELAHAGVGLVTRRCERAVGEVGVGRGWEEGWAVRFAEAGLRGKKRGMGRGPGWAERAGPRGK